VSDLLFAKDRSTDRPTALGSIGDLQAVANFVYDSGSLTFVPEEQGGGGGGGGAVTVADGADVAQGATTDAEATGNGTVVGILKRLRTLLAGGLPSALVGGRLDVNVGNTPAVSQSGAWTVTANAGSGTQATDPSDRDARLLGRVKLHDGTDVALVSAAGELAVQFLSAQAVTQSGAWSAGRTWSLSSGSDSVAVTGTVSLSGAVDTELPAAAALADGASNPTTPLVGAAAILFNGTTWDRARGDTTNGLDVDVTRVQGTVTVAGTVTANAGTNLNTSLLALESGGNLASAVTALQIIDDWDESDRAKVNPIAGQAGVQGGSGAVNSLTQRVVLATDVALPTGANVIGAVTQSGTWNIGTVTTLTGITNALPAGSNNIGDVDVLTLPALPAGANTIGAVNLAQYTPESARLPTQADMRRGLAVAFASIDAASSGDNTVVAADATRKIKVLSYLAVADAAVTVRWKSGASTNLSGAMSFAATGGCVAPPVPPGGGHWLETAVNQALVLNLGGAVGVRGHLSYVLEA
jgi:hypothetical protein